MPSHQIVTESLLNEGQQDLLGRFCPDCSVAMDLSRFAAFLLEQFGVELILDPDVVGGFISDSSNLPGKADALVRPRTEFECAVILRACHLAGIPVTVSGGKSNLTGSATPEGGVLLSTVNLSVAPDVNPDACTARTGVGVILENLRKHVVEQTDGRLCFPVDPTSRAEASIGGAIACNCSGFTPGDAGAFRSWVKSIRFLLPDGRLIAAERGQYVSEDGVFLLEETVWPVLRYHRPAVKNAAGPFSSPDGSMDFIDLVVGSEGIFGLVTECTLKLAGQPSAFLDLFISLPNEETALHFLATTLDGYKGDLSGLRAFEYFGVNCRRFMKYEDRFFRGTDAVGIYIRQPLEGIDELTAAESWLELLSEAGIDLDEDALIVLDSLKLQDLFFEARHSMPAHAIEIARQRGAFTIMSDTVVPPDRFAEFLEFAHRLFGEQNLDYLTFGHLGDCHLHFMVIPHKEQLEMAVAAYDSLVAKSTELGGVYSGEHGTGKRKRKDFLRCYGPDAADQVRRMRQVVDPRQLFNHGNVVEW